MQLVKRLVYGTLASSNHIVKNRSIHSLTKIDSANTNNHRRVRVAKLSSRPRSMINSLRNCYSVASSQVLPWLEEDNSAKYKVCPHGNSEVSYRDTIKQSMPVQELHGIIGTDSAMKKKQSTNYWLNTSQMKTEDAQSSDDALFVISSSQKAGVIHHGPHIISYLLNGSRHVSVNAKVLSNNLLRAVKFRPAVITRECHTLHTSSSLSFILDKYSFRHISCVFSSSSSSASSLPTSSAIIEKNDIVVNKTSEIVAVRSENNLGLKVSGCEFNKDVNMSIKNITACVGHGESTVSDLELSDSQDESTVSDLELSDSQDESTVSDLELSDSQDESHNIYSELYFNLINNENQALESSDLQKKETTSTFENYAEMYNKLMNPKINDKEDNVISKGRLTHTDNDGKAVMVDVGDKMTTLREAQAEARIYLGPEAGRLVKENKMKKGDVLTVAQLAGIMAAKQTAQLIPLCHNINLTKVDVVCVMNEKTHSVDITSIVRTLGVTGVEMEALTAASIAALTVYDMCKAVTHDMVISDVRLVSKSGGKRHFQR